MKSFLFALASFFAVLCSARRGGGGRSSGGYKCGRPALPFSGSGAQQYAHDIDYARRDYYGGKTSYNDMMGAIVSIDFFALFADGGSYGPGDFERYSGNMRGMATSIDISFTYVSYINGDSVSTLRVSVSYSVVIFGNHYNFPQLEHDFHFDRHSHDMREIEYRTPSDDVRYGFRGFRDDVYRGGRSSSIVGGGVGNTGPDTSYKYSSGPSPSTPDYPSTPDSPSTPDYPSKSSSSGKSSKGSKGSKGSSKGSKGSSKGSKGSSKGSKGSSKGSKGSSKGSKGSKGSGSSSSDDAFPVPDVSPSFASLILEWWIVEHPMLVWFVALCGLCAIAAALVQVVSVAVKAGRGQGTAMRAKTIDYEQVHITSGVSDISNDEN